eukprot:scaffold9.g3189.t1
MASEGRHRSYPDEPRVGVGVVILRQLSPRKEDAETLLIRRAKEPNKGWWCFCGGSLELGETMAECAVREAREETGVVLRNGPNPEGRVFSRDLAFPVGFATADALFKDDSGRLAYHYAIVDFAAVPEDPHAPLAPADDVDAARWFPVADLRDLPGECGLVPKCAEIAEEAVRRFDIRPRSS